MLSSKAVRPLAAAVVGLITAAIGCTWGEGWGSRGSPAKGGAASASASPSPQELSAAVESALRSRREELLAHAKGGLVDPDGLFAEFAQMVRASCSDSPDEFMAHRFANGAVVDRETLEASVEQWRSDPGMLGRELPKDLSTVSTEDLLRAEWASVDNRLMRLRRIDCSKLEFGTGISCRIGSKEWPYSGAWIALSRFKPPGDVLCAEAQARLDGTNKSAHLILHVVFADGYDGLMHLGCLYVDGRGWQPVSIAVASKSPVRWPDPLI